jgi:ABC transporter DrrB family efflux protein
MAEPMIEVEAVAKRFGSTQALAGVDLVGEAGKVLALLGPNGAGKTTLVRILTTLLKPDRGRARVAGYDVVVDAQPLRSVIGLAGQYAAVDELLTGRENLEFVGLWYHLEKAEYRRRAQDVLERFSLTDAADRLVKTYSGGMRRRLDVGASLMGRPPVLFFDEPTTGLDPRTRNDVWRFIEDLVAGGTTVLLTTQYMDEAEHLAHHIVVIDRGDVIAQGTAAELKDRMGGDTLEVRVARRADLDRAAALLAEFGEGPPHVDPDQQQVRVPTNGGTNVLLAAGQRFEDNGIDLDDLGIRRPSLDDVFLSLTGAQAAARPRTDRAGHGSPAPSGAPMPDLSVKRPRAPAPRMTPAVAARDTAGIAKRNLLRTMRTPRLLVVAALQPALLLVLFRYVLGGAVRIPGGRYVDFVVPAVFLEAVLVGGMATAIGLAQDLNSGLIDRFRSLPMARSAVLAGRTVADLSRSTFSLALMVGLGLLVGFRFHATPTSILGGMALIIVFGYAFSWMYATIALFTKDPETAQIAGVLPFFILMFASSAIVPVATLPSWLQPFARDQPFSVTVGAVRALLEGGPAYHWVWQSLVWSAGIFMTFFIVAVHRYHNITS